jgi:surface protein
MKNLKDIILEKLKISSKITSVKPSTKKELQDIIVSEVEKNGYNCNLNFIDTSELTDFNYLFHMYDGPFYHNIHNALKNFNGDISGWDVSNVTDMTACFYESSYTGEYGGLDNWDVSNVVSMSGMFIRSKFSDEYNDINNWDVSNVESMPGMFREMSFNGDISSWDVLNVKDTQCMFYANKTFNQNLSKWKLDPTCETANMFGGIKGFPKRFKPKGVQ